MKNMLNNQKGLTLMELLGALTISMVIIGVASMLLTSVMGMFNSDSQKFHDKQQMKLTMNTLTAQLVESTQVVYYPANKEFRYKSGLKYKSLILNSTSHELSIYDFSNDGNTGNDDDDFKNSSITIGSNVSKYSNRLLLNDNVASAIFYQSGGTIVPTTPLTNGDIVEISITFNFHNLKTNGTSEIVQKVVNTSIKLLADYTTK
jgi:Flp pilus assembly pilin Flp